MDPLVTILLSAVGGLLTREIWANAPRLGRWLIERAVLQLPASERDRYREEWLSHLEESPGAISKLRHALGCYVRAARELAAREQLTPSTEKAVVKFTIKIVARIWTLPYALPLLIRGKSNNAKVIWKTTEIMMLGIYLLKNKFGATDADVKAVLERFNRTLQMNKEGANFSDVLAALDEFSGAVREIRKRRWPNSP